jgi:hypothetical protein
MAMWRLLQQSMGCIIPFNVEAVLDKTMSCFSYLRSSYCSRYLWPVRCIT